MRKGPTILTKVIEEVTDNLSGGEMIGYFGTYEPGKGFSSVHAAVTREGRQALTINHQHRGQIGHNFSAGGDFKTMETAVDEVLSDIDGLCDGAGSESVRLTTGNEIIIGVSND